MIAGPDYRALLAADLTSDERADLAEAMADHHITDPADPLLGMAHERIVQRRMLTALLAQIADLADRFGAVDPASPGSTAAGRRDAAVFKELITAKTAATVAERRLGAACAICFITGLLAAGLIVWAARPSIPARGLTSSLSVPR